MYGPVLLEHWCELSTSDFPIHKCTRPKNGSELLNVAMFPLENQSTGVGCGRLIDHRVAGRTKQNQVIVCPPFLRGESYVGARAGVCRREHMRDFGNTYTLSLGFRK